MVTGFTIQGVPEILKVGTLGTTAYVDSGSGLVSRGYLQYSSSCSDYSMRPQETIKERRARIAIEKMYASWKTYNDKTETIKEIKQICKPRHKINHMGRR